MLLDVSMLPSYPLLHRAYQTYLSHIRIKILRDFPELLHRYFLDDAKLQLNSRLLYCLLFDDGIDAKHRAQVLQTVLTDGGRERYCSLPGYLPAELFTASGADIYGQLLGIDDAASLPEDLVENPPNPFLQKLIELAWASEEAQTRELLLSQCSVEVLTQLLIKSPVDGLSLAKEIRQACQPENPWHQALQAALRHQCVHDAEQLTQVVRDLAQTHRRLHTNPNRDNPVKAAVSVGAESPRTVNEKVAVSPDVEEKGKAPDERIAIPWPAQWLAQFPLDGIVWQHRLLADYYQVMWGGHPDLSALFVKPDITTGTPPERNLAMLVWFFHDPLLTDEERRDLLMQWVQQQQGLPQAEQWCLAGAWFRQLSTTALPLLVDQFLPAFNIFLTSLSDIDPVALHFRWARQLPVPRGMDILQLSPSFRRVYQDYTQVKLHSDFPYLLYRYRLNKGKLQNNARLLYCLLFDDGIDAQHRAQVLQTVLTDGGRERYCSLPGYLPAELFTVSGADIYGQLLGIDDAASLPEDLVENPPNPFLQKLIELAWASDEAQTRELLLSQCSVEVLTQLLIKSTVDGLPLADEIRQACQPKNSWHQAVQAALQHQCVHDANQLTDVVWQLVNSVDTDKKAPDEPRAWVQKWLAQLPTDKRAWSQSVLADYYQVMLTHKPNLSVLFVEPDETAGLPPERNLALLVWFFHDPRLPHDERKRLFTDWLLNQQGLSQARQYLPTLWFCRIELTSDPFPLLEEVTHIRHSGLQAEKDAPFIDLVNTHETWVLWLWDSLIEFIEGLHDETLPAPAEAVIHDVLSLIPCVDLIAPFGNETPITRVQLSSVQVDEKGAHLQEGLADVIGDFSTAAWSLKDHLADSKALAIRLNPERLGRHQRRVGELMASNLKARLPALPAEDTELVGSQLLLLIILQSADEHLFKVPLWGDLLTQLDVKPEKKTRKAFLAKHCYGSKTPEPSFATRIRTLFEQLLHDKNITPEERWEFFALLMDKTRRLVTDTSACKRFVDHAFAQGLVDLLQHHRWQSLFPDYLALQMASQNTDSHPEAKDDVQPLSQNMDTHLETKDDVQPLSQSTDNRLSAEDNTPPSSQNKDNRLAAEDEHQNISEHTYRLNRHLVEGLLMSHCEDKRLQRQSFFRNCPEALLYDLHNTLSSRLTDALPAMQLQIQSVIHQVVTELKRRYAAYQLDNVVYTSFWLRLHYRRHPGRNGWMKDALHDLRQVLQKRDLRKHHLWEAHFQCVVETDRDFSFLLYYVYERSFISDYLLYLTLDPLLLETEKTLLLRQLLQQLLLQVGKIHLLGEIFGSVAEEEPSIMAVNCLPDFTDLQSDRFLQGLGNDWMKHYIEKVLDLGGASLPDSGQESGSRVKPMQLSELWLQAIRALYFYTSHQRPSSMERVWLRAIAKRYPAVLTHETPLEMDVPGLTLDGSAIDKAHVEQMTNEMLQVLKGLEAFTDSARRDGLPPVIEVVESDDEAASETKSQANETPTSQASASHVGPFATVKRVLFHSLIKEDYFSSGVDDNTNETATTSVIQARPMPVTRRRSSTRTHRTSPSASQSGLSVAEHASSVGSQITVKLWFQSVDDDDAIRQHKEAAQKQVVSVFRKWIEERQGQLTQLNSESVLVDFLLSCQQEFSAQLARAKRHHILPYYNPAVYRALMGIERRWQELVSAKLAVYQQVTQYHTPQTTFRRVFLSLLKIQSTTLQVLASQQIASKQDLVRKPDAKRLLLVTVKAFLPALGSALQAFNELLHFLEESDELAIAAASSWTMAASLELMETMKLSSSNTTDVTVPDYSDADLYRIWQSSAFINLDDATCERITGWFCERYAEVIRQVPEHADVLRLAYYLSQGFFHAVSHLTHSMASADKIAQRALFLCAHAPVASPLTITPRHSREPQRIDHWLQSLPLSVTNVIDANRPEQFVVRLLRYTTDSRRIRQQSVIHDCALPALKREVQQIRQQSQEVSSKFRSQGYNQFFQRQLPPAHRQLVISDKTRRKLKPYADYLQPRLDRLSPPVEPTSSQVARPAAEIIMDEKVAVPPPSAYERVGLQLMSLFHRGVGLRKFDSNLCLALFEHPNDYENQLDDLEERAADGYKRLRMHHKDIPFLRKNGIPLAEITEDHMTRLLSGEISDPEMAEMERIIEAGWTQYNLMRHVEHGMGMGT